MAAETEENESLMEDVASLSLGDDALAMPPPQPMVDGDDALAQSSSASPPQSPPPPPEISIRKSSRARKEPVKYSPSFSKNKKR